MLRWGKLEDGALPYMTVPLHRSVCMLYLTQGSRSDEDSGLVILGGVPDSPVSNMLLMLLVAGLGLHLCFSGVSILQNPPGNWLNGWDQHLICRL